MDHVIPAAPTPPELAKQVATCVNLRQAIAKDVRFLLAPNRDSLLRSRIRLAIIDHLAFHRDRDAYKDALFSVARELVPFLLYQISRAEEDKELAHCVYVLNLFASHDMVFEHFENQCAAVQFYENIERLVDKVACYESKSTGNLLVLLWRLTDNCQNPLLIHDTRVCWLLDVVARLAERHDDTAALCFSLVLLNLYCERAAKAACDRIGRHAKFTEAIKAIFADPSLTIERANLYCAVTTLLGRFGSCYMAVTSLVDMEFLFRHVDESYSAINLIGVMFQYHLVHFVPRLMTQLLMKLAKRLDTWPLHACFALNYALREEYELTEELKLTLETKLLRILMERECPVTAQYCLNALRMCRLEPSYSSHSFAPKLRLYSDKQLALSVRRGVLTSLVLQEKKDSELRLIAAVPACLSAAVAHASDPETFFKAREESKTLLKLVAGLCPRSAAFLVKNKWTDFF